MMTMFRKNISNCYRLVYAYSGGLFEWLMLQDIYGQDLFPTTKIEKDILKFKACSILNISLLEN